MKIAIVILNYNSCADSRKCIGFLKRQQDVDTEIVDNHSPKEGEQERIKQLSEEQAVRSFKRMRTVATTPVTTSVCVMSPKKDINMH